MDLAAVSEPRGADYSKPSGVLGALSGAISSAVKSTDTYKSVAADLERRARKAARAGAEEGVGNKVSSVMPWLYAAGAVLAFLAFMYFRRKK